MSKKRVGIFELAFEVSLSFVAEIEEEFSLLRFDAALGLCKIVDLNRKIGATRS